MEILLRRRSPQKIVLESGKQLLKIYRQDIKKGVTKTSNALILIIANHYFLCLGSDETVNL
jgi:hypothetical protein